MPLPTRGSTMHDLPAMRRRQGLTSAPGRMLTLIRAASDHSRRSTSAVARAGLLGGRSGARLAVLPAVEDDRPAAMVAVERRTAAAS